VRRAVVAIATAVLAACGALEDLPHAMASGDPCRVEPSLDAWIESENLSACAALGDARAQAYLGFEYWSASDSVHFNRGEFDGMSQEQLKIEGRRLIESAASQGNREAQNELALAHLEGTYGVPVDVERAFTLLTTADLAGDPMASYNLARIYYAGYGLPRSQADAERFLWRSAASGYQPALCTLALLRERGEAPQTAEVYRYAARALNYGYRCAADGSDVVEEFR
jgi:TPR repeat protein